jgi:hypothetical protein
MKEVPMAMVVALYTMILMLFASIAKKGNDAFIYTK